MSKYNIKYRLFTTNSGTLYQIEEEWDSKKTNFYAYDLQPNFQQLCLKQEEQITNCRCLRKYVKQIDYNNQKYILFEFIEGESLERYILNKRGRCESISFETIKQFLIQLLDTLYQLHQKNILGRVFSTKNIMTCNGQLLLLDFGFGPKIVNQELEIIAPPEIINIYSEDQSSLKYDIKIDSWLLGAVLFHLVKLRPINAVIDKQTINQMLYKHVIEYSFYLKTQMAKLDHIDTLTERYPKEFCYFIQGLLTYDVNKRFSFVQIYKNQFIKNLNLPKYSEYLKFYEQFNEIQLIKEIKAHENASSEILNTKGLLNAIRDFDLFESNALLKESQEEDSQAKSQAQNLNYIPPLTLESNQNLNNQPITFQPTSSRSLEESQAHDQSNIEKYFPHEIQGQDISKFYQIWQFIRMEQFRFTFLEKTAEDFIVELQKKNFQLEYVCAYFLKKMGYLILVELLRKINEENQPWICIDCQGDKWKEFKRDSQKDILENNIKQKIKDLETILKDMFFKDCKIYLKDDRIEKVVRDQLQADLDCFQGQKNEDQSIYKCSSDEFLKNGYRQVIQTTSKFVEREMKLAQKPQIKYNTILLKALTCHLINRIFNLNTVSLSFQGIIKNKNCDLITPNEIYKHICREDEQEKILDIKQIMKVNCQPQ